MDGEHEIYFEVNFGTDVEWNDGRFGVKLGSKIVLERRWSAKLSAYRFQMRFWQVRESLQGEEAASTHDKRGLDNAQSAIRSLFEKHDAHIFMMFVFTIYLMYWI